MNKVFSKYVGWGVLALGVGMAGWVQSAEDQSWPPKLKGAKHGTVKIQSEGFLKIPAAVAATRAKPGVVDFVMAREAPVVDLAFHGTLPNRALNGTGWSAWGDICVAGDGRVYVGLGDHGDEAGGQSHAYLYCWDPTDRVLKQIVDLNAIVPRKRGEPTWSKVHARIAEGADGGIYFSGTLNDGNLANKPVYKWSESLPGGQLYRYDPQTGMATVVGAFPPARCTATSLIDRERNLWWCNLETGSNALCALDLTTGKIVYKAPDGSMGFNRNFALAKDGTLFFNGPNGALWKVESPTHLVQTKTILPNKGMRASTSESKDGFIYGVSMSPGVLFRYSPARDEVIMLGPDFGAGDYSTVCVLSPDERFLYYLPGAHGHAYSIGTPVIQYTIATGQRKVIAFLREVLESEYDYVPGGTYGVKLSADGSTLYANLNGHAGDRIRPKGMPSDGFGLTAFVAVHIPESER
jgi:sugar lactone lactonase YvrE